MTDAHAAVWSRPQFEVTAQRTRIFFVCFGNAPLGEVALSRERFGVPGRDVTSQVQLHEHRRDQSRQWFEGWWSGPFAALAARDLGAQLPLLTTSDTCFTLQVDLPDQPDLAPIQSVWALSRWLCARGASVVLDVHAFRYRDAGSVEQLGFERADVQRDVKLVLEAQATQAGLHLLHTRGLCKFARPELTCFIHPDDAVGLGPVLDQIAGQAMAGAPSERIRVRVADGVELVTRPVNDGGLIESLGLEAAVAVVRADGASLEGIGRRLGGA